MADYTMDVTSGMPLSPALLQLLIQSPQFLMSNPDLCQLLLFNSLMGGPKLPPAEIKPGSPDQALVSIEEIQSTSGSSTNGLSNEIFEENASSATCKQECESVCSDLSSLRCMSIPGSPDLDATQDDCSSSDLLFDELQFSPVSSSDSESSSPEDHKTKEHRRQKSESPDITEASETYWPVEEKFAASSSSCLSEETGPGERSYLPPCTSSMPQLTRQFSYDEPVTKRSRLMDCGQYFTHEDFDGAETTIEGNEDHLYGSDEDDIPVRPSLSYVGLIITALLDSPLGRSTAADIYDYVMQHYPFYEMFECKWKEAIRHNLSKNPIFKRVESPTSIRKSEYIIDPERYEVAIDILVKDAGKELEEDPHEEKGFGTAAHYFN